MSEMLENHLLATEAMKNPSTRRKVWAITLGVTIVFGCGFLLLSWLVPWLWLKVICCLIGMAVGSNLILGLAFGVFPLRIPPKLVQRASAFMALWITVAIFFVHRPAHRWSIAGGIAAVIMVPGLVALAWRFLMGKFFPDLHFKTYQRTGNNRWGRIGIVVSTRGTCTRYAQVLVKELNTMIMATASKMSSSNSMFFFMPMDSFAAYPESYRQFAVSRTPLLLVVRKADEECKYVTNDLINAYCEMSSGLVYDVVLLHRGTQKVSLEEKKGVEVMPFYISTTDRESETIKSIACDVIDRLKATGIPIGESDDGLSQALQPIIVNMGSRGMAPLANCYLRFRLSKSNVERFLGLIDCVEAIIKISVIYLIVNQWQEGPSSNLLNLDRQLERPTLGHWLGLLRQLTKDADHSPSIRSIVQFWEQPLKKMPKQLISDLHGSGLAWQGEMPRSYLGWADWFNWLRNVTRGHGAVEEDQAQPMWLGMHEVLLEMTAGLGSLMLDAAVSSVNESGEVLAQRGWGRSLYGTKEEASQEVESAPLYLINDVAPGGRPILVHPLMIKRGHSVLLWNKVQGELIQYIDYGSGQLISVDLGGTSPYDLWQAQVASSRSSSQEAVQIPGHLGPTTIQRTRRCLGEDLP